MIVSVSSHKKYENFTTFFFWLLFIVRLLLHLHKQTEKEMTTIKAFHGTDKQFTEFVVRPRKEKVKASNYYTTGETEFVYFSSNPEIAKCYGSIVLEKSLVVENPFIIDAKGGNYYSVIDAIEIAISEKVDAGINDSIMLVNIQDSPSKYGNGAEGITYMVKPSQIK
jgi:hypothetical protein